MPSQKTFLVTGGCGYLGSQLTRDLCDFVPESEIRILDNFHRGHQQALMNLPTQGEYEIIEGDILDPSVLRLALRGVDAVIHLAAVVQTPLSFEDPNWVEQVNHWGTSHLVEACLEAKVEDFIYASSAAVYGPGGPFSEEQSCDPMGAYAHSKHQAEQVIQSAGRRGLVPTILRFGTFFGEAPVTRFTSVANKFAYLAGVRRTLTIYGEGGQKRPFIHVKDASNSICWALRHREQDDDVFNIVGTNASVLDIAKALRGAGIDVQVRFTEQDIRTHLSFEVDGSRIRNQGWHPSFPFGRGLCELAHRFRGFKQPVTHKASDFQQ